MIQYKDQHFTKLKLTNFANSFPEEKWPQLYKATNPDEFNDHNFWTFEKLNIEKIQVLHTFLKVKLHLHKYSVETLSQEGAEWCYNNVNVLDFMLNSFSSKHTFFSKKYFFRFTEYSQKEYQPDNFPKKYVGRLYQSVSLIVLPKEIRYYLTKQDYKDFDIVNSHPTILYNFALKKGIKVDHLGNYVKNRDVLIAQICSQLGEKTIIEGVPSNVTYPVVKKIILESMNQSKYVFYKQGRHKSKALEGLFNDFLLIRNALWNDLKIGDFPRFQAYVTTGKFLKKTIEKQQVSFQCLFCQDFETIYVKKLAKYIKKEYELYIRTANNLTSETLLGFTAKTVEIDLEKTISLIPMYDGLLVSSCDTAFFNEKLSSIVEGFNKNFGRKDGIRFVEKVIEKTRSQLTEIDDARIDTVNAVFFWCLFRNNRKNLIAYLSLRFPDYSRQKLSNCEKPEQIVEILNKKNMFFYYSFFDKGIKNPKDVDNFITNYLLEHFDEKIYINDEK